MIRFVPKLLTYVCSCGAVYDRGPSRPYSGPSQRLAQWKEEHRKCP